MIFVLAAALATNIACTDAGNFAVQFKLDELEPHWDSAWELSSKERGDLHWRLRKMLKWASALPGGCEKDHWIGYINLGLSEAEDTNVNVKAQEIGHILAKQVRGPPKP